MEPQKITELANLLRNNGDKILNSEFTLTLSGSLLRALNDSFTLIAETAEIAGAPQTFRVLKPNNSKSPVFRDLQLVYDFVQKTSLLCIVHYPGEDYFEGTIDIGKFHTLKCLELQKTDVRQVVGIQPLRSQLQQLICVKSLRSVEDIITHCGGDNSNGFVWNELKVADFSYNNLQTVDSSLEFAQFLQHLNLRHNQLHSVEAIKWLPQLKTLDLSFNRLQCIPQFHMEACKRMQSLNMNNNFVEDLMGIAKLDSLTDLNLSDNCLLDHTYLLPLSALMTLKYLNLYGNPLHFHPKHRLASAQYLHKNTASVKFILDFEPLSKNEKALTGTKQLRHVGALSRYRTQSSTASISSGRQTPASHTPSSSVGSLRSFKFNESSTDVETATSTDASVVKKARAFKVRTVEIEEEEEYSEGDSPNEPIVTPMDSKLYSTTTAGQSTNAMTKSLMGELDTEHLEAKQEIKRLREKYGAEWLHSADTEMMHSVLGIESSTDAQNADLQRHKSRKLFQDFIGELADTSNVQPETAAVCNETINVTVLTSTPTNDSFLQDSRKLTLLASPITYNGEAENDSGRTLYMSMESSEVVAANINDQSQTQYTSALESALIPLTGAEEDQQAQVAAQAEAEDEHYARLQNIFSSASSDESEVSESEDELTYIVCTKNQDETIFLTLSADYLRERDHLTKKTKTKWSLKILESCDLIKANTLRINFDTVKADKKERIYTDFEGSCQELQKKLREILSQRDLSEMNQTIYRCVNCTCQFSRENKNRPLSAEVRCPDCKSTFVAEIHYTPESLERVSSNQDKLSPAAIAIVDESPITTPLVVFSSQRDKLENIEETASIGSATSLNESSSCSKITNSQSSFDSNQSVVGSSNTDRDNDFKSNCESDVDILSNPSQSSIEVLDQAAHLGQRKTSAEERRISQMPHLETIDDQSYTQSFIGREFSDFMEHGSKSLQEHGANGNTNSPAAKQRTKAAAGPLAQFNLTESSSSGSITDSVCTAYEQQADKFLIPEQDKTVTQNLLAAEAVADNRKAADNATMKREDSGISSVFGALFQSTNLLMSSSKKMLDAEASANIQTGGAPTTTTNANAAQTSTCKPYKFSYSNFGEIDHRLKLYFCQTKFEEQGEHFKWLARGRIYNEGRQTLCDGFVLVSTCKIYLMEAFAPQHDDVTKWLRQVVSATVDRLECIQLLPWKLGLTFTLRDWGGFLLLLQDILRTDSLLLHFTNNSLPSQCELNYKPAEQILKRLSVAVGNEQLKMCALLNGCEVNCDSAKRTFNICALLTTDTHLYLTSSQLSWLSLQSYTDIETDLQICVTQLMSNLVEVERVAANVFTINFLDETQDKCELWTCTFETKENADSCLNAIGQSWELLFGVPLLNA